MIESFLLALCTLVVALYIQARFSARTIRRNREEKAETSGQELMLKRRI